MQVFYRLSGPEVVDAYQALTRLAEAQVAELGRVVREYFFSTDGLLPMAREELIERVRTGDVIILDVRPAMEYQNGHIAGAISIPVEQLEDHIASLPPDREVVAYCRGPYCVLAAEAVRLLRKNGYKAVRLADGFPEWKSAGLAIQTSIQIESD